MFDRANAAAEHGANEKRGGEHAAGRSAEERDSGREELLRSEHQKQPPRKFAVQRLVDNRTASTENLREPNSHDANDESRGGRKQEVRPARQGLNFRPDVGDPLRK